MKDQVNTLRKTQQWQVALLFSLQIDFFFFKTFNNFKLQLILQNIYTINNLIHLCLHVFDLEIREMFVLTSTSVLYIFECLYLKLKYTFTS